MNRREAILNLIVVIIGLIILNTIIWLYNIVYPSNLVNHIDERAYPYLILINLLFVFLGILIEWKKALMIFSNKTKIDKLLLIISIIMIIISMVPFVEWFKWFGFTSPMNLRGWLIGILQNDYTRNAIPIIAGILFVKSFCVIEQK